METNITYKCNLITRIHGMQFRKFVNMYTIVYKEFMHKELRLDKQILEEQFDVKFLSASFHVKFINCCRDITPGQWKTSYKVAQMCQK